MRCVPPVPVAAPDNTQVLVVNSTLVEVHWDPVAPKSIRGHLRGYKVSGNKKTCTHTHIALPDEHTKAHARTHACMHARAHTHTHTLA